MGERALDESFFSALEVALIQADVGVATTQILITKLKEIVRQEKITENQKGLAALKKVILETIFENEKIEFLTGAGEERPKLILVLGVNGSGKTTFAAKLAHYLKKQGKSILFAAGDTFRPAATEQLKKWAARIGVFVVSHKLGADPAAVIFDAIRAARARQKEIIIADTAGRLHTKENLLEELKKIIRVSKKEIPQGPAETLLVIDATTGQNGLVQAKTFHANIPLTGIVLTKTDGTAKGGIMLAIRNELKIPVKFICFGEKIEALKKFDAKEFVDELVG